MLVSVLHVYYQLQYLHYIFCQLTTQLPRHKRQLLVEAKPWSQNPWQQAWTPCPCHPLSIQQLGLKSHPQLFLHPNHRSNSPIVLLSQPLTILRRVPLSIKVLRPSPLCLLRSNQLYLMIILLPAWDLSKMIHNCVWFSTYGALLYSISRSQAEGWTVYNLVRWSSWIYQQA